MRIILLLAVLFLLNSGYARGQTPASDMLPGCRIAISERLGSSPEELFMSFRCIGYAQAFLDTVAVVGELAGRKLVCLPPRGITPDQAIRIVIKYYDEHPESLHLP